MSTNVPYIRADIVKSLLKDSSPRCFHCGENYTRDKGHSGPTHTTWKPTCECLDKTIRVVTGGEIVYDTENPDPRFWNE